MSQGTTNIIDAIISKSQADAKNIIRTAERVAEREISSARRAAAEREQQALRALDEDISSQMSLAEAHIQAEAERMRLNVRHDLVESLLAESLERLKKAPRDEAYFEVLKGLIVEAAGGLGVGEQVVMCPRQDRELLASEGRFERVAAAAAQACGAGITLSDETIEAAGGAVLASPDGKISYYNTFDEIAYRGRSALKALISDKLFG